ncbi:hypothetical protein ACQ4PT_016065 [Festuca glaucescens]
MAAVSHDVVREILVRLNDMPTLFRCATVCKGWRSLVAADDSFLRRCFTEELEEDVSHSPPFAGFFTQQRARGGAPAPCFIPAPRPVLCAGRRPFLSSFVADVPPGYFDYAVSLTSRHGLLLVRLGLRRAGVDPHPHSGVILAVCDLLAGTVHELPRLESYRGLDNDDELSGYALLTAADCSSSPNEDENDVHRRPPRFFKVLIATIQKSAVRYHLHTFSSAHESGWCFSYLYVRRVSAMLRQHNAVVCGGGVAHWLLRGKTGVHTLDVSAKTGRASATTMIDIDNFYHCIYEEPYLTVDTMGTLMLLGQRKDGRKIKIWTPHNGSRWPYPNKLRRPYGDGTAPLGLHHFLNTMS